MAKEMIKMSELTNTGLVEFARSKIGTPYIYGAKQTKGKETALTLAQYKSLQATYGKSCVWESDVSKVGKICCDCSGLISWYTGKIYGSSQYKSNAAEVHTIDTIKNAPVGVAVWLKGHIGIYSGMKNGVPYYIAEDGSAYGCREVPLSYNNFTHWFKISDICYEDEKEAEDTEMVEKIKINVNGKEYEVNRILKDNKNFICLSDMKQAGFDVGYNERTKVPSFGVAIEKDVMSIGGVDKEVSKIMKNDENFLRLRDLESILNIVYDSSAKKVSVYKK